MVQARRLSRETRPPRVYRPRLAFVSLSRGFLELFAAALSRTRRRVNGRPAPRFRGLPILAPRPVPVRRALLDRHRKKVRWRFSPSPLLGSRPCGDDPWRKEKRGLRIEFFGAEDLAAKLFELSQAMANNWQAFARVGSAPVKNEICPGKSSPITIFRVPGRASS